MEKTTLRNRMKIEAKDVKEYIEKVPFERKVYFVRLRKTILENLPQGFVECINYGMIGYVVPHSIYSDGYHCNPSLPLPFVNIASQKHFIAFYHHGLYAEPSLMDWFRKEYTKYSKYKIDMGKSCVRFKRVKEIPYELIAEVMKKISVKRWIELYESSRKR